MRRLAAVYFDIDDTLCATSRFAERARRNAVRAMVRSGLDADEERVWEELEEVVSEFSSNYEHHFDKLLLRLPADALRGANRALVVAAAVAAYHDTKFRELSPHEGVRELLGDLRQAGVRRGIITHGLTQKQAEKIHRLGLAPYIDHDAVFISDEIGIAKPNPKLYLAALRHNGLSPEETMVVGDNPRNDVAPPKSLGMITVLARITPRDDPPRPRHERETPDHVVQSFGELRRLLVERYGVPLPRTS